MFFFLPIGVEDQSVDRLPWVSIGIAALCVVVFAATWVLPAAPDPSQRPLVELVQFWTHHPYLEPPADPGQSDLSPRVIDFVRAHGSGEAPAGDELQAEQRQLDDLIESYREAAERNPFRRWGLVPARGLRQAGWITHLFLHLGWLHLLGNMLFFYLVGPLLEDIWGRPLFAGFYLVSGLVAAFAQFALDPSSQTYVVGASGAIAGSMGAFTWRFARRRIKIAYFYWLVVFGRGTFQMRAWIAGLLWFGQQLLAGVVTGRGGGGSVAFMAHVGGFAFGLGVAALLGLSHVEEKLIAPAVEAKVAWVASPELLEAREALEAGRAGEAETAARRALAARADDREALLLLSRVAARKGDAVEAARLLEKALLPVLARSPESAWEIVDELGGDFLPRALPPGFALRLATALQNAPEGLADQREKVFEAAAAAGGPLGAKALRGAAERRLASRPDEARAFFERARALPNLPAELQERIAELERRLPAAISLDLPEDRSLHVTHGRLLVLATDSVDLQMDDGQRRRLPLREVQAVGVGAVPAPAKEGQRPRKLLIVDLVTSWGGPLEGPTAVRLSSDTLAPQRFFPGVPPLQGYAQLIAALVEGSGAPLLPDGEAVRRGAYITYGSVAAFEAAVYASPA